MTELIKEFKKISGENGEGHTKQEREKLLKKMTNEELDYLIQNAAIVQAKIYYSKFKK